MAPSAHDLGATSLPPDSKPLAERAVRDRTQGQDEHPDDLFYQQWYLYTMAMNIKDPQTEALAAEVAALANETKTQAVRTALQERKQRLQARQRRRHRADRIERFLKDEAWPQIPDTILSQPISKADREAILGLGPEGA
jgi:antitoxin VapB